jgi:hypothetical protein
LIGGLCQLALSVEHIVEDLLIFVALFLDFQYGLLHLSSILLVLKQLILDATLYLFVFFADGVFEVLDIPL